MANNNPTFGYADVVLEYFDSGEGPIKGPYGGIDLTGQDGTLQPVSLGVVLGDDPGTKVNALSLPTGSFVTVGFTDETIIDGPGNDIFIREIGNAGDRAEVFVSSDLKNFELLGTATDNVTTSFDLASTKFKEPVKAVKIVGLDNKGSLPGFDVVNVKVLENSIGPKPTFDDFVLSSSKGAWASVNDKSDLTGLNTNELRWGISTGDGQSGLKFDGVGLTSVNVDEVFELGTLTHFNRPITSYENLTKATLEVNLDFALPDSDLDKKFNFNFGIDETTNAEPCPYPGSDACSDKIVFPDKFYSETFSYQGQKYTLELVGFGSSSDSIKENFISEENSDNSLELFAKITEVI